MLGIELLTLNAKRARFQLSIALSNAVLSNTCFSCSIWPINLGEFLRLYDWLANDSEWCKNLNIVNLYELFENGKMETDTL